MALIKIKQINNNPAVAGDVITYDGTKNVWAQPSAGGGLITITSFITLPGSPTTNDIIYYTPFNSVLKYDGTDWVGSKITIPLFGSDSGHSSRWLLGIGESEAWGKSGNTHGYYIPDIVSGSGGGSGWKIYNMSSSNRKSFTGDVELHKNVTSDGTPTFGSTGIIKIAFSNQRQSQVESSAGIKISGNDTIQCFARRTSGTFQDPTVLITYSLVAEA